MKQSLPTKNAPPQAQGSGPLDTASTTNGAPQRGEIFEGLAPTGGMKLLGIDKNMTFNRVLPGAGIALCLVALGSFVASKSKKPEPIGPFTSQASVSTAIKVQVEGQVNSPGVYDLPSGSRVQDALQKAGGALPEADLSALNLAEPVADGTKLVVPARGDSNVNLPSPTLNAPPSPVATPIVAPLPPSPTVSSSSQGETDKTDPNQSKSSDVYLEHLKQNPVDLNLASANDLQTLPGVGPKMAARILDYRQKSGGFKRIEELDNIEGIGEKRMSRLRQFVVIK